MAPHSIEAEEAVLGSLLIDPDAILRVASFLRAEDFYRDRNGWIYQAILDLHERREPADFVTLCEELQRKAQLEEVGGPAEITRLVNAVPTAIHVEYYGRLVEQAAIRRRLISAAGQIATLAYDEAREVDEVVDQSEQILFGVSERRLTRDLVPIDRVIHEYYDRIEYLYQHRGEPVGVPTGFVDIDRMLGGMQRSDLLIVAARPGMGKTAMLLSMARTAAKRFNQRVAVFSLEMSREQVVQRLVSAETGINSRRLRVGELEEDEWPLFVQATGVLAEFPIFIDDTPSISALQLRTKARRLHAEYGLDLVMVDYLQLMRGDSGSENRVQEISYISRALKGLARELNVPVLAASQLSRAVESRQDKHPMLSDLRESGCLTGDTPVYIPDTGHYVPIRELVGRSGFEVLGLNTETWELERCVVGRAFATGSKEVHRLVTRLGRTIRASANHRFLTVHGWKRLDELRIGERVAVPRRLKGPSTRSMSDAELALLGHLIGDGCTLPRHAIQYTTGERDLAEMVAALTAEVFGDEVAPRIRKERNWHQVYLSAAQHLTHNTRNPVAEWLDGLGVFGLRSHEKQVPTPVFEQSREGIALFLKHLWATDGCIHLSGGKDHYASVYYASSSLRLAYDVQSLLLRLGINARTAKRGQGGRGRDQYHVTVSGKPDVERFIEIVGTVGDHKERHLAAIEAYLAGRSANTNRDSIPSAIWRMYVVPAMRQQGMTARQMQSSLGNAYCGTTLYKQNVSRERAARIARVVRSDHLARLAASDVYWDEIVSIQADGTEDVYDLTVPGPRSFVASNIVVHNSIEQDADVVMFIYRDQMYNEDTEDLNLADISVAKHRNGPTGRVQLYFRDELATFSDAETRVESLDY
jgi:replicative DNA helicase